ncbi:MAG: helicase-exonuclease AddAB subunit AddA [Clostridiales Family XIII bacterium]|jgi:ATP-dependent helicase/nuclease subunit A|nr:helicase-exonuclease AddAB subunit AddA [Clostridiales Family XIII bacterium]
MPEWTKEQLDAIDIRGKNILVAAAAGSGKTAVLTERIKQLVTVDRVPVSSLLVLTFTDAAASEMRRRVEDALGEAIERDEDDDFLRVQLRRLRSAQISTFHSFALNILKNYYYVIGMEPSFRVCDDFRAALTKQDALDILFEERFASGEPSFTDFLDRYADSRGEDGVRGMILWAYGFIRSLPEPFEWLDESVRGLGMADEEFLGSGWFAWLRGRVVSKLGLAADELSLAKDMLEACGAPVLAGKISVDIAAVNGALDVFADGGGWDRMAEALAFRFQVMRAKKDEQEHFDAVSREVKTIRDRAKALVKSLSQTYFMTPLAAMLSDIRDTLAPSGELASLIRRFDEIFTELKRGDGLIDFDDIEHLALEILKDDRVADELRDKFDHIFVDEYQDSNYVQEALISKVRRTDNLFMVGDVKQSIYRFRHAEPGIFIEKYKSYPNDAGSRRVDLNMNFRSRAPVIGAVNGVFSRLMKAESSGGIAYDEDAALKLGLPTGAEWDMPVELRVVDVAADAGDAALNDTALDDELSSLKDAELEALAAAAVIREARGTLFYDAGLGASRPMEYGDMVVLLREAKTSAPIFTEVLLSEGINAYAESGGGYLDTVEIETFMNLLRVIDNARQDVPLVSALYSPVFGFTIDELAGIRMSMEDRRRPFYRAFLACADGAAGERLAAKCGRVIDRIAKWRREESFMELSDFLWLVLKESGWYDYAGALVGGELRRANLLAMTTRAAEYGSGRARGLFGFIQYIESVEDKQIPIPQAKLVTEGDDVVRVMTVHKSKGLEYPLVIAAGLGKGLRSPGRGGRLVLHREFGLALTREDPASHTWRKTLLMNAAADLIAEEERAELLRLLYVAMTRVRDRLVLIGCMKGADERFADGEWLSPPVDAQSAKSFIDMLLPLAHEAGIRSSVVTRRTLLLAAAERASERGRAAGRLAGLDAAADAGSGGAMSAEIDRRLSFSYPHEAAVRLKSKYSVSELNRKAAGGTAGGVRARYYVEESEAALAEDEGLVFAVDESLDGGEVGAEAPQRPLGVTDAAARGVALHKALERLDYAAARARCSGVDADRRSAGGVPGAVGLSGGESSDTGATDATRWFDAYLDGLVSGGFLTPEQRASASAGDLTRFASSDICARAAASPRVRRETPFNYRMDMDGERITVQGVIDLFFEEGDGLVLVDFKSGGACRNADERASHALETYGEQMRLYRNALEAITGKCVKEALLYLTAYGQTVTVPRADEQDKPSPND